MAVYADVAAPVLGDVDPSYDTTPTLTWTSESGPTTFDVTIGDATPVSVSAGSVTEGKWDSRSDYCEKVGDVYTCTHTYEVTTALASGDVTWTVVGKQDPAIIEDEDSPTGYTTDPAEKTFTIYGDVAMTLATDVAEVKPGGTVTATVSMDSAIEVSKLTFSVTYDATLLTLGDVEAAGLASAIDPGVTPGDGKVTVTLEGTINAGAGDVATLPFTVADGAATTESEDVTLGFVTADGAVESPVVADPDNPDDLENPASWGEAATVTVLFVPEQGDIDGNGTAAEMADLLIALKAAAGLSFTADVSDYTAEYGPVGVPCAAFILGKMTE